MSVVSLRIPKEEKIAMEKYSKFYGISVSALLRELFAQRLEDEEDLEAIQEYEKEKRNGTLKTYSFEEVKRELGLES